MVSNSSPNHLHGAGRRVTVRYPLREGRAFPLVKAHWPASRLAAVRDVSRGGLGLVLDVPVARGERVWVELPVQGTRFSPCRAGRVAHVRDLGGGAWAVGVAFDAPLPSALREALLDLPAEGALDGGLGLPALQVLVAPGFPAPEQCGTAASPAGPELRPAPARAGGPLATPGLVVPLPGSSPVTRGLSRH
jgi:hypothetical protein